MKSFIDKHRVEHGVEPICKVLLIAPSTYYAYAARQADPQRRSQRSKTDDVLMAHVERVWNENFQVYGVRKVWRQLRRERFDVARCTVERLMKRLGLRGVIRGKKVRTTVSNSSVPCPLDRVNRQFRAERPNAVGKRLHLCLDVAALCVRCLHHRRVRAQDRGLERFELGADRLRARCS
jgi:transposase InsO family protein